MDIVFTTGDAIAFIAVLGGALLHFRSFGRWEGRMEAEYKALREEVMDLKRKIESVMRRSDRTTPPIREA